LAFALAVRVALLLVGYVSLRLLAGFDAPFGDQFFDLWNRWDAPHYLRIAEVGYRSEGEDRLFLVFFPLYPLAVRIFHFVIPNYVLAGLAVSLLASVAAALLLQSLVRLDSDDAEEARRSVWYLFLFPTAYFLAVPYSEALFLASVLAAFWAARQGRWAWAGVAGLLACSTRLAGLALLPGLVVEAFWQERGDPQGWQAVKRLGWLLLVPLGFVVYLLINWQVLGDPLGFFEIQREHWFHELAPPWQPLQEAIRAVMNEPPSEDRTMIFEARLAAFAFAAAALALSARWLRPSYQVYAWSGLLLVMSTSWLISLPRYLLAIFPLFLILARLGRSPPLHQGLSALSALLMGLLFALSAAGRWAF
jgi:hypothetical protein